MGGSVFVRSYQHGIAFAVGHGHGSRCVAVQLYKFGALQAVPLVRERCRKPGTLEEKSLVVAAHAERKACGRSVVLGLVSVCSAMVELGVCLVVVERTAIVHVERAVIVHRFGVPPLVETCRKRDALIGFEQVAGFCLVVEIVGTEVERELLGLPFKRLGKIEQLAVHVCLEPCREVVAAFAPLHLDQSAGKVAVLYGRNAAHDGYFLYVVGGDGAHIDTCIGEVPLARGAVHCARKVLHVAVYAHGCTVDDEARAQRRGVVLVAGYGYFAQVYGVGHVEMGVVGTSAGQQFQQVGET